MAPKCIESQFLSQLLQGCVPNISSAGDAQPLSGDPTQHCVQHRGRKGEATV